MRFLTIRSRIHKGWLASAALTLIAPAGFAGIPTATMTLNRTYPAIFRADLSGCEGQLRPVQLVGEADQAALAHGLLGAWRLETFTRAGVPQDTRRRAARLRFDLEPAEAAGAPVPSPAVATEVDWGRAPIDEPASWQVALSRPQPELVTVSLASRGFQAASSPLSARDEVTFAEARGVFSAVDARGASSRWDKIVLSENTLTYVDCDGGVLERYVKVDDDDPVVARKYARASAADGRPGQARLLPAAFVVGPAPSTALAPAQKASAEPRAGLRGWTASFPQPWPAQPLPSVGAYKEGPTVVYFESLSPLLIEPSQTGAWTVLTRAPHSGHVAFRDTKPALVPNPDPEAKPFYKRAEGAITALAWVDQEFGDVRVSVRVNTLGGPDGEGSLSRQGPMMRWDKGSNFLWCAVNFASGTVNIKRSQHFGIIKTVRGSQHPIKDFNPKKPYVVEFDGLAENLRCRVYDGRGLVADTGPVKDDAPLMRGVSGALVEVAFPDKPFEPLEGSFADLASVELKGSSDGLASAELRKR